MEDGGEDLVRLMGKGKICRREMEEKMIRGLHKVSDLLQPDDKRRWGLDL